ncbi:TonB-dependent siderophore receptor [Acetobacteraceae bacterium H6797]|nr:TonB-dependent siderophore receptor [Acetobacteraceae bacterium H6797]
MSGPSRTRSPLRKALPGVILLSGAAVSGAAMAQTAAPGAVPNAAPAADPAPVRLPEISVSGQAETAFSPVQGYVATRNSTGAKTDTPIIEVPQSISVVTRDQLDQQNAQTLNGALRYTAGITPETRGGIATRYDMLKVRGFDADTYWNGLKLIGNDYYGIPQLDPYLMQRIEVLRGPTSVLYGQAAAGGLLNQESRLPSLVPVHEIGIEFGNFRHQQLSLDLGGPLTEDGRFSYRLTAIGRAEDGQVSQTRNERIAIAPSFTWRPDNDNTFTLYGLYQHDPKSTSYGSVPPVGTVLSNPYGRLSRSFYDGDPNFENFDRTQMALGYQFEHRFNEDWKVRSNARWFYLTQDYKSVYGSYLMDDDRTLVRGTAASTDYLNTFQIDNQIEGRFFTGPVTHTVLAGFDYKHLNSDYRVGFGSAPDLDIFNPVYNVAIEDPVRSLVRVHSNQYGLYAQDQARLGNFILTVGGRQDWVSNSSSTLEVEAPSRSSNSDSAFTGRVGLTYVFDNGIAPYVSLTQSFVPLVGIDSSTNKPFVPEEGQQYEVGIKYQPTGINALFTAALFNLKRNNLQVYTSSGQTFQTGSARSQGLELEAKYSLTESLNLTASYTWLDTVYTAERPAGSGKHLPAVPEHQGSAWAYYTFNDGPLSGLSLGAGARYTGQTWSDNNEFKVRSFLLADATVNYDLGRAIPSLQGAQAYVNAQNLFDKTYVASCYYGSWCAYGYGRQVFAGVKYRW